MSDPTDIQALNEYLTRDSEISRRYRELGREEAPPELDRRVLEQARAAVAGTRRSRSWVRWSAPVALAASIVLVVTIVLESPSLKEDAALVTQGTADAPNLERDAEASVSESQAPGVVQTYVAPAESPPALVLEPPPARGGARAKPGAPPSTALPANAEFERAKKLESRKLEAKSSEAKRFARDTVQVEARALREQSQAVSPVTVTSSARPPVADDAPPSIPQALPSVVQSASTEARKEADDATATADIGEVAVTGSRVQRTPSRTVGPRGTISSSSVRRQTQFAQDASAGAAAEVEEHPADPEKWLEEIRELRRAGKTAEADRAWQRFREAFPDFVVAEDDLARQRR